MFTDSQCSDNKYNTGKRDIIVHCKRISRLEIINLMQVTNTHIKDSDVETDVALGNGLRLFKWSI